MENLPKVGEIWTHYKAGGNYEIIEFGQLQVKTELDYTECVVYKNKDDGKVWIRPIADFVEVVDVKNNILRFKKVD